MMKPPSTISIIMLMLLTLRAVCTVAADELSRPVGTDIVVKAEGLSACVSGSSADDCRRAALSDALRRAVEKGVGVLVEGDTRTRNYLLVEDAVRTTSEGYVRDYRVIEETCAQDMCRVSIEASIAPGQPVKTLSYLCRRLNEEIKPVFYIDPGSDSAGSVISNEFAALGLVVVPSESAATIIIRGRIQGDPLGEAVKGSAIFSAGASSVMSAAHAVSGVILPSMNISLDKPEVGLTQENAVRRAEEAASKLWIRRNIPLIAAALLEPGRPIPPETELASPSSPARPGIFFTSGGDSSERIGTISRDGDRLLIEPGTLGPLARKLAASVVEKSEFASLPVDIAVAPFRTIGISDRFFADDVLEDLSASLTKGQVFELVERSELDTVLKELRVQNSGIVDSDTAKKLGGLVGAKAVIVGSISDRGDRVVIYARLINTENGRIRVAESIVIEKEPEPTVLRAGPRR